MFLICTNNVKNDNVIHFDSSWQNDILAAIVYNNYLKENSNLSFSVSYKIVKDFYKDDKLISSLVFCSYLFNQVLYLNNLKQIQIPLLYINNDIYNIDDSKQVYPKMNKNISYKEFLYELYCEKIKDKIQYKYHIIVLENDEILKQIQTKIEHIISQMKSQKIETEDIKLSIFLEFKNYCIFDSCRFFIYKKCVTEYHELKQEIFNAIDNNKSSENLYIITKINDRPVIIIPYVSMPIKPIDQSSFMDLCESNGIFYISDKYSLDEIMNNLLKFIATLNYYE